MEPEFKPRNSSSWEQALSTICCLLEVNFWVKLCLIFNDLFPYYQIVWEKGWNTWSSEAKYKAEPFLTALPTASTIMFHSCLSDIQKVVPILRIRLLIKSSFLYFLYFFLFLRIYCSCCWFFFFLLASIFNGDFKATLYFQFTNLLTLICVANYYTILSLYYVYSAFYHTQILSFS